MHTSSNQSKLSARLVVVIILLLGALVFAAAPSQATHAKVVDIAATPDGAGFWVLFDDGHIETGGNAAWLGNGSEASAAIAVTPSGDGYWIVRSNGQVEAFGAASQLAGVDHLQLAAGIIDAASTPSGGGLWLVAGDGGIFTSGDARFYGSTGGMALARPVVGIAPTAAGDGYWLVARDGGIFTFGNAQFIGSMGSTTLDRDVIAVVASPGSSGYLMIGADGGIFAFGSMPFHGSLGGQGRSDIVGAAPLPDGSGYFMATISGGVFGFGKAAAVAPPPPPPVPPVVDIESQIELEIFDRINSDRALRGLPSLRWDRELATTAGAWSNDMVVNGFRHSDLGTLLESLATFHLAASENIYWGSGPYATSAEAHQSLMDSAGHRRAILETAYTTVGIGVTCSNGRLLVTEQFGHPETDGPVAESGDRSRNPQVDFTGVATTSC